MAALPWVVANKRQRSSWRTQSLLPLASVLFLMLLFAFLAVVRPNLGLEFWVPLVIGVVTLMLAIPGTMRFLEDPAGTAPERRSTPIQNHLASSRSGDVAEERT